MGSPVFKGSTIQKVTLSFELLWNRPKNMWTREKVLPPPLPIDFFRFLFWPKYGTGLELHALISYRHLFQFFNSGDKYTTRRQVKRLIYFTTKKTRPFHIWWCTFLSYLYNSQAFWTRRMTKLQTRIEGVLIA